LPARTRADLVHLVPTAEKWGIGDDCDRKRASWQCNASSRDPQPPTPPHKGFEFIRDLDCGCAIGMNE
jgi:hypothetical protein